MSPREEFAALHNGQHPQRHPENRREAIFLGSHSRDEKLDSVKKIKVNRSRDKKI